MFQPRPSPALDEALAADARVDRQAYLMIAAVTVGFTVVNALTFLSDYARVGREIATHLPWLYEISSAAVILALLPLLAWFTRRFPFSLETWRSVLPLYLGALIVFSALHVAGMVAIRKVVFALLGHGPYLFIGPQGLFEEALYEFRKDALTFFLFVLFLALWRRIAELKRETQGARAEAEATRRLTLKCGGRTLFLDAGAVDWAKAAGNYVEIAAGGKMHLARMTLTALEEQLEAAGANVVRAHRSWLVNRARIREIAPAGEGDVVVRLDDGAEIPGSRRYRERLAAPAA